MNNEKPASEALRTVLWDSVKSGKKVGKGVDISGACCCMGPQNGEPYCPCRMRSLGVKKKNGRWVVPEQDLGPVEGDFNFSVGKPLC